jgi:hypothetical protein
MAGHFMRICECDKLLKNCSIFSNSFTSFEASCITKKTFCPRIGKSYEEKVGTIADKNISFSILGSSVSQLWTGTALSGFICLTGYLYGGGKTGSGFS